MGLCVNGAKIVHKRKKEEHEILVDIVVASYGDGEFPTLKNICIRVLQSGRL